MQGEQTHERFRTHKAASLLAYLALHLQQTHPRERLLDLLWPEMELSAARVTSAPRSRNCAASSNRQAFPQAASWSRISSMSASTRPPSPPMSPTSMICCGRRGSRRKTEIRARTKEEQSGREAAEAGRPAALLEQAIALYRGPLLPGWNEEWATAEQTRCQSEYLDALRELTKLWEAAGSIAEALAIAQQADRRRPV